MSTSTEFSNAYIRLRTLLDALESNTISWVMDGTDTAERIARIESIESELIHVIDKVDGKVKADLLCRPGYYNCGGVCVPYECVQESLAASAGPSESAP